MRTPQSNSNIAVDEKQQQKQQQQQQPLHRHKTFWPWPNAKSLGRVIPYFKDSDGNGYKLWERWFLGSFRWAKVSYDWSLIFVVVTINQSWLIVVHPNYPRNPCSRSFYKFLLLFLEWGIGRSQSSSSVAGWIRFPVVSSLLSRPYSEK